MKPKWQKQIETQLAGTKLAWNVIRKLSTARKNQFPLMYWITIRTLKAIVWQSLYFHTATVTPPVGFTDTNSANNSATDTDCVPQQLPGIDGYYEVRDADHPCSCNTSRRSKADPNGCSVILK